MTGAARQKQVLWTSAGRRAHLASKNGPEAVLMETNFTRLLPLMSVPKSS